MAVVPILKAAKLLGYSGRTTFYRLKDRGELADYLRPGGLELEPEGLPTLAEHLSTVLADRGQTPRQPAGDSLAAEMNASKARKLAADADAAELERDELRRQAAVAEGTPDPASMAAACTSALYAVRLEMAELTADLTGWIAEAAGCGCEHWPMIKDQLSAPLIARITGRCDAAIQGLDFRWEHQALSADAYVRGLRESGGPEAIAAQVERTAQAVFALAERRPELRADLMRVLR